MNESRKEGIKRYTQSLACWDRQSHFGSNGSTFSAPVAASSPWHVSSDARYSGKCWNENETKKNPVKKKSGTTRPFVVTDLQQVRRFVGPQTLCGTQKKKGSNSVQLEGERVQRKETTDATRV